MATGAVTASSVEIIKRTKMPNSAPKITLMSQLAQEKTDNFKAIAKALNTVKLDEREAEIFAKLESGELVGLKDLKKSFVTLTKEKPALEEDDVLIKKFREQNPFKEGDNVDMDGGAAKEEKEKDFVLFCSAAAAQQKKRRFFLILIFQARHGGMEVESLRSEAEQTGRRINISLKIFNVYL